MRLSRDGARGALYPSLVMTDELGADGPITVEPLVGRWPIDDCGVDGVPIGLEESRAELGGKTFAQLKAEFDLKLTQLGELPAQWRDSDHGALRFGVDANHVEPHSLCVSPWASTIEHSFEGWSVSAELLASVTGSQSNLSVSELSLFDISVDVAGDLGGAFLGLESELVDSRDFEHRFGVANVAGTVDCGFTQLRYEVFYSFDGEAPASEGQLDVIGFDSKQDTSSGATLEHGTWCTAECQVTHSAWY